MSALPLHAPIVKLASASVPEPLRRLFREADLAELPASVSDLHLDTDMQPGNEKVLLTFRAERADINLFVLLSPSLRSTPSTRLEDEDAGTMRFPGGGEDVPSGSCYSEPSFPWWQPDEDGPGRRFAYSTQRFDFVEVIIEDLTDRVFIRAVN